MNPRLPLPLFVLLLATLGLSACQRTERSPSTPAASSAAAVPAPAVESAPPASAEPAQPADLPQPTFDLASVPITRQALPPFPYIDTPAGMKPKDVRTENSEFEAAHVLAGTQVRRVEGKIASRWFELKDAKLSALAAYRNYEAALKELGATRVDQANPKDKAFIAANGGNRHKLNVKLAHGLLSQPKDEQIPGYQQYLLRTPDTNIWITVFFWNASNRLGLRVVEEQAMRQVVSVIPAAQLSSALKKDGHVAVYLNFDTDSHAIRPDSLAGVDQIAELLRAEPDLKLRVEGHTDATGEAAHNRSLSQARAESVVRALSERDIAAARLRAVGKGADQPLGDNGTEEGKARNRRVELVRI